ncbi:MAG: hypothetical protein IJ147_09670 [Lachnospiraceae bacterium]|nr:hypothetical protein [Lachnospiraceae bacterium]
MATEDKPLKLQEAHNLYRDSTQVITNALKNNPMQSAAFSSLLENIKWGLEDVLNEYTEYDYSKFLAMIVRVNMIYECTRAILGDKMQKTEDMLYFKFIRDTISHPKELNSSAYRQMPYQPYMKYIFVDFRNVEQTKQFFGFPRFMKWLFDEEDEEFVLQMNDPDTGELLFLVCPYSKIWNCLYDIIKQLVDKIE